MSKLLTLALMMFTSATLASTPDQQDLAKEVVKRQLWFQGIVSEKEESVSKNPLCEELIIALEGFEF